MRRRRVELGEEETSLGPALVADDVTRDWVAVREKVLGTMERRRSVTAREMRKTGATPTHLRIRYRRSEEFGEILISLLVLISGLAPLGNSFPVENEDVEEGIEEQDDVGANRD